MRATPAERCSCDVVHLIVVRRRGHGVRVWFVLGARARWQMCAATTQEQHARWPSCLHALIAAPAASPIAAVRRALLLAAACSPPAAHLSSRLLRQRLSRARFQLTGVREAAQHQVEAGQLWAAPAARRRHPRAPTGWPQPPAASSATPATPPPPVALAAAAVPRFGSARCRSRQAAPWPASLGPGAASCHARPRMLRLWRGGGISGGGGLGGRAVWLPGGGRGRT